MARNRSWTLGLALLAAFLLWPAAARAVPAQLNVQGVLFDESGAPAEGATSLSVRVYAAADGVAPPLWEPAAPLDVLCEAGVFNALVPAATEGAEVDALAAAFTAGEPRWLGIAPAGGAELSPRIPVVSVAYALVAGKAAVADLAEFAEGLDCAGCVTVGALDPAVQTLFLAYDGSASGLTATTYRAAIDELAGMAQTLTASLAALQTRLDGLASVATSGAYGDLAGTPDLCAEAFACDATLALLADLAAVQAEAADSQARLDVAEVRLADAEAQLAAAAAQQSAVWCLLHCDPLRLGDCRARTCDGAAETCSDAGPQPDGTACGGGNGRCVGGECFGAFCGGVSCPYLAGYRVACNEQAHCEYTPVDPTGWRAWDVWIWVPAGSFLMGAPAGEADSSENERPVHEVTFASGFFVMKYEVVVTPHLACEAAGRCTTPSTADWDGYGWGLNRATNGRQNHPQNGLTWQQARDFCAWAAPGGRLPSEAEWEYAAAGPVHRKYPWGNTPEPTCDHAVFDLDGSVTRPFGCDACTTAGCSGTQPVGARPAGASWVGAMDMSGNVWEWCEDWHHENYTGAPVDGSAWVNPPSAYRVLRGGSFAHGASYVRSAKHDGAPPADRIAHRGARCVRPLLP